MIAIIIELKIVSIIWIILTPYTVSNMIDVSYIEMVRKIIESEGDGNENSRLLSWIIISHGIIRR